jgi:hypothetical protein
LLRPAITIVSHHRQHLLQDVGADTCLLGGAAGNRAAHGTSWPIALLAWSAESPNCWPTFCTAPPPAAFINMSNMDFIRFLPPSALRR